MRKLGFIIGIIVLLVALMPLSVPVSDNLPAQAAEPPPPVPPETPSMPPPQEPPPVIDGHGYACEEDLIEVMFAQDSKVRLRHGALVDLATNALTGVDGVLQKLAWFEWYRICDVPEERLDEIQTRGEANTGKPVYNLNNIYRLRIPMGLDVWAISEELEALSDIMLARPVPKPMPLPTPPNYVLSQGYLRPASSTPVGIDADYAWTQTGGNGTGVTVCDLEYSWNYNHADITKALGSQVNPNPITDPFSDNNHGTAVIGELVSDNNSWGTTGICYGASLKTCGTYYGAPSASWNPAGAIAYAIANLSAGDVILLEQQWDYDGGGRYIPVEWYGTYSPGNQTFNPVYAAIVSAVSNGIHVVEAGGNGNVNTDNLIWYGNSGAIIVGAGGAYPGGTWTEGDLERLSFSSYGSRFDLQGWGEDVVTTGYGDLYNSEGVNYQYTNTFSGTSSASPIVAGAVAVVEGNRLARGLPTLSPAAMRSLLVATGTPQNLSVAGNIGPRPNLARALLEQYNLTISSTSGGNVTYPGEGTFGSYDNGTVVGLDATPDTGYHFVNWTGDTGTIANSTAANTTMTGNYSITANFAEISFPVHNINTTEDFATIQAAIDAGNTTAGHTITVAPGTYPENVNVYKQLTIESTSPNPADTIVNATNPDAHVFNVSADWVNITGFTVGNATGSNMSGIYLYGVNHCNISNNVVSINVAFSPFGNCGIYLNATHNSTLENNVVSNSGGGIGLENSTYNNVTNNNVSNTSCAIGVGRLGSFHNRVINNTIFNTTSPSGNSSFAIGIMGSRNNTVDNNYICNTTASGTDVISAGIFVASLYGTASNNTITNNEIYNTTASGGGFTAGRGIFVWNTTDNKLLNNTVSSNDCGIELNSASINTLTNNTVTLSDIYGIHLHSSSNNNTLTNNTASNNTEHGIALWDSSNNTLTNNTASNNDCGINLDSSSNNNTLTNNTANGNDAGIYLYGVNHCNISNNVVSNSEAGIGLENSTYNNVTNNNVSNTSYAINAWRLNYFNRVINNTILNTTSPSGNHSFAIVITDSGNNTVDNNYISNTTASGTDVISAGIIVVSLDGTASNNTITNNEIYNTTASGGGFTAGCGIFVMNTTDNRLLNNTVSSNDFGIALDSASINTLTNNTVTLSDSYGINLNYSSHNNLINNTASNNWYGIGLYSSSHNNTLTNNTANDNENGIHLGSSSNNILTNNTASNNSNCGIALENSSNSTLTNNTADQNDYVGIGLNSSSNNNVLMGNTVNLNDIGIGLKSSSDNNLTNNTADQNGLGIGLDSSSNNTIYNNYFSNTNNAWDNGTNTWNTTNSTGPNIVGGPRLGGNYWSDYSGNDTNGDGFGDTPYNISGGASRDYLPLVPAPVRNIDTGEGFYTIQAAIDAVNTTHGDTLTVDAGTCNENVDVYKQLTIRSTSGNPADTIVSATDLNDHVFNVTADWVNITGFTVENATGDNATGIYLYGVNHCNISNNVMCSNNMSGIYLNATHNSIVDNNMISNSVVGIGLENSTYNNVTNNNVSNTNWAIDAWSSHFNRVINNTIFNTTGIEAPPYGTLGWAIDVMDSSNNLIDNNRVYNTTASGTNASAVGICVMAYEAPANNNTITNNEIYNTTAYGTNAGAMGIFVMGGPASNNTIANNGLYNATASGEGHTAGFGIYVRNTTENKLLNNTVSSNDFGIMLNSTGISTIANNTVNWNTNYGIYLSSSSNNTIYNNYFSNTNNAWDNGTNTWNTTNSTGPNIVWGPYIGGNYWSDYTGNDTTGDGFGDTQIPYNCTGNITNGGDYLPLILTTATLEGHVSLTGLPATNVTVRFFDPGTQNETMKEYTSTDSNGNFTIGNLTPGSYDVAVKGQTSLSNLESGVSFTAGNTTPCDFGVLLEGDASGDDYVYAADFGILSGAWKSWPGQPNWDARADFSRDDYIFAADFGVLSGDWKKWGDCYGWPGSWT